MKDLKTSKKKIKDLTTHANLRGLKVRTHTGQVGYWGSQWGYPDGKAGVWLFYNKECNGRMEPVFLDTLSETLEWEILDD